jgi:PAS domain S-box-containing protein
MPASLEGLQISGRATAILAFLLDRRGILLAPLLEGLPVTEAALRNPASWHSWDVCADLLDRVAAVVGGGPVLADLFSADAVLGTGHDGARMAGFFLSPASMYQVAARWAIGADVPSVRATCTELGDSQLRFRILLDPARRGSEPFLWVMAGALREMPVLMGLGRSHVTSTITSHEATYVIAPPRVPGLLGAARNVVRVALGARALVERIARQQEEILANNRLLAARLEERRVAEQALRESESRFRAAADGSLDAFFLLRAVRGPTGGVEDFVFVDINVRGEQHLGMPRATVLGRRLCELRPVNRLGFLDRYVRVLDDRQPIEEEFSLGPPNERRFLRHQVVPVGDGIAITTRDVTERVLADDRRREGEAQLAVALEAASLGAWTWDVETGDVRWSPGVYDVFGVTRDAFDGTYLSYVALLHPDDAPAVEAAIRRALDGAPYEVDHRVIVDGRTRWVSSRGTVLRDGAGKALRMTGTVMDVTARKEAEARVLLADRLIAVGTLAAGVAHEVNNPLTYVLASIERIDQKLPALRRAAAAGGGSTHDVEESLDALRDGARRVRDIVRDLHTLSRSNVEKVEVVDTRAVVEASIRVADHELRGRARVVRDFGDACLAYASDARLGQVLINLLVNAAQAMPDRDPAENEIVVRTRRGPDGDVVIEVEDNGVGMSPEVLKRVFDPFYTTKAPGLGTGLGLAICHGLVTSMGGRIEGESQVGRGSILRVVLMPVPTEASAPTPPGALAKAGQVGHFFASRFASSNATDSARSRPPLGSSGTFLVMPSSPSGAPPSGVASRREGRGVGAWSGSPSSGPRCPGTSRSRTGGSAPARSTSTSGVIPSAWMTCPDGVKKRIVVRRIPAPFGSERMLWTLPLPNVRAPTMVPRLLSCSAPATSSLALALNSSTRTTSGVATSAPPGPAVTSSMTFPRARVV